jgi:uncharacterized protein
MQGKLPDQVDPKRLAQQGARLTGALSAAAMKRLASAFDIKGDAQVELRFGWSDARRPRVTGRISVPIASTCQRCLQPYATTLQAEIDLEIGESPRDGEPEFELVLRPDERLGLPDLIEDELLLAAPMIALHARGDCGAPAGGDDGQADDDEASRRPFADLQALWERTKK